MCKCIRPINFIFMGMLILLEITTFIIYFFILILTYQDDKKREEEDLLYNTLFSSLNIVLNSLSIWIIFNLGIHALYFKKRERLFYYILR